MGKVKGTWLLPSHSGRPCHHESIYTKMDKKTGQCYSVKLCNPNDKWTELQVAHRNDFGIISRAIAAWVNTNEVASATDHAAYMALKTQFDRQNKYSTIRGFMMAKNMAEIQEDGMVKITIGLYTTTVDGTTVNNGTGGNGSGNQGGNTPAKKTLTLSVSPTGAGTVSGAGQYDQGATASISATAASGYTFTRWSDGNTSASRSVVMTNDLALSAIFNSTTPGGDDEEGDDSGDAL